MPLHSSLGDKARHDLKKKKEREAERKKKKERERKKKIGRKEGRKEGRKSQDLLQDKRMKHKTTLLSKTLILSQ